MAMVVGRTHTKTQRVNQLTSSFSEKIMYQEKVWIVRSTPIRPHNVMAAKHVFEILDDY